MLPIINGFYSSMPFSSNIPLVILLLFCASVCARGFCVSFIWVRGWCGALLLLLLMEGRLDLFASYVFV